MMNTARLLCFAVPALALLAAACGDNRTTTSSSPYGIPSNTRATAPNANNPYATDPQDPNMNPDYMRGGRGR